MYFHFPVIPCPVPSAYLPRRRLLPPPLRRSSAPRHQQPRHHLLKRPPLPSTPNARESHCKRSNFLTSPLRARFVEEDNKQGHEMSFCPRRTVFVSDYKVAVIRSLSVRWFVPAFLCLKPSHIF